jgi:MFS family permease
MGFSYAKAQILSSPPYVFAMGVSLVTARISDKLRIRWPVICAQCLLAATGLLIVLYAKPPGVRYFGLFFAVSGCQANAPVFLAYAQNQTALLSKRGVVAAAIISIGAVGGICGSTIFRSQDAPV